MARIIRQGLSMVTHGSDIDGYTDIPADIGTDEARTFGSGEP